MSLYSIMYVVRLDLTYEVCFSNINFFYIVFTTPYNIIAYFYYQISALTSVSIKLLQVL